MELRLVPSSGRWAAGILLALFVLSPTPAAEPPVRLEGDTDPPVVLVSDVELDGDELVFQARVVDPSGIKSATLWLRDDSRTVYREYAMRRLGGGEFELRLDSASAGRQWLAFYVEAFDRAGNGPGRNGSPDEPFVAQTQELAVRAPQTASDWLPLALIAPPSILILLIFFQRGRAKRERAFWVELLAPLARTRGPELDAEILKLCMGVRYHPERGQISIDPATARAWLDRLRADEPAALEAALRRHHAPAASRIVSTAVLAEAPAEQIAEELFWFRLLSPLIDQRGPQLTRVLRDLASRVHAHPIQGRRVFPRQLLSERLERVRRIEPSTLFARADALADDLTHLDEALAARTPRSLEKSAGKSLIEMLIVLALVALMVGIAVFYLRPLEAPVKTSGEMLDGLIKQTRAVAMVGTTAHRIRPASDRTLVVESAASCAAGAWTLEPRLGLELVRDVVLSDTAWDVCFNSRGIASTNVVLTLIHPQFESRQLEILQGGLVRWLE